jgi:prepilin peptidase CpaA
MTIPNRVSLVLIAAYLLLALYLRLPLATVGLHVSCGLAMLALTFAMFQMGWIGGGDAKLAAATALWLGWPSLFEYGLAASLIGGVLTLAILALRHFDLPEKLLSFAFVAKLAEKNGGVPYGIALALAGLAIYPHTGVWTGLAHL